MKYLLILLLATSLSVARGQDISESSFYTSLYKNFKLSDLNNYRNKNFIFSLKVITNERGQVVSWQTSSAIDSVVNVDITKAFSLVDRNGLIAYNLKKATLIIPVMILSLSGTPEAKKPDIIKMWDFKSDTLSSVCDQRLLPPIMIYNNLGNPIDN